MRFKIVHTGSRRSPWEREEHCEQDHTAYKALGICWELPSDKLHLLSSNVDLPTAGMDVDTSFFLRTVASLFDALGLMSPVTITGRISNTSIFVKGERRFGYAPLIRVKGKLHSKIIRSDMKDFFHRIQW